MKELSHQKLLALQNYLLTRLGSVQTEKKLAISALREMAAVFEAPEAAFGILKNDRSGMQLAFRSPKDSGWDTGLMTSFLLGERPEIPRNVLLAKIVRKDRPWGVLAMRDTEKGFTAAHVRALLNVNQILVKRIQSITHYRELEVRQSIQRKIARRVEPKDLVYHILHGIRSLTNYDHSASLLIAKEEQHRLELIAEQIAWKKAKSKKIGMRLAVDEALLDQLREGEMHIYTRSSDKWACIYGPDSSMELPQLLDYHRKIPKPAPSESAMLCAPVVTPDGTVAVLKLSATSTAVLQPYEAKVLDEFMPLVSMVIQFLVRTESLHERMLQAERKHVLADLARGIAHDVNNALGSILPLVQQLSEEAHAGSVDQAVLAQDLETVEQSIQTCRQIFGSMLAMVRGYQRSASYGNLRRVIDSALQVLQESLRRHEIGVEVDLPEELPVVCGGHGDLTQLFLNLCANARDAMFDGGQLSISAQAKNGTVEISVQDTGQGIPENLIGKVMNPFFTTKTEGNGLGLAICRSILWDIGGRMKIDSEEGKGTHISVSLPVYGEHTQEGVKV